MRIAFRLVAGAGVGLLVGGSLMSLAPSSAAAGDDISGVVRSASGPEAGVWVIAETSGLDTPFRKIVVTDDAGRFLIPDLPAATYQVWVRGYGLVDSDKQRGRPGDELTLTSKAAATPQEAAAVYPANYWYALLEVPPPSEFPGTGDDGNGINPNVRTQAHWIDSLKDGCQMCHQMGDRATREVRNLSTFKSAVEAWDKRVQVAGSGHLMNSYLTRMGRRRAAEMFAQWTDRIRAGEVPPAPPRPRGTERNVVVTMWGWSAPRTHIHDNIATDKRNPGLYPQGPVYGVSGVNFVMTDPVANRSRRIMLPDGVGSLHNPMLDGKGRVWLTATIRRDYKVSPEWCKGSDHPFSKWFPLALGETRHKGAWGESIRQLSYFDTKTQQFALVDTCYQTHHLQFAEDANDTLWLSGDTDVVGWLNTRQYDQTRDEYTSQGWCPTVLDTNGDGMITWPWNEPGEKADTTKDTRLDGFAYGIIPNPIDGSIWIARGALSSVANVSPRGTDAQVAAFPGPLVRLELGNNPPQTCKAEIYEPPFGNPTVDPGQWGYGPRGIDVDRKGVIWTALSGSGHLASFDRRKCKVLKGPIATGQHCPEGWTLYQTPGPKMKGVVGSANADFHYYNWVDQFNTLGLGENVPMASGSGSDSLLALVPRTGEWVVMRVPYPLGFYTRGLNGRIDDPKAGWKGRSVWGSYDTGVISHKEDGSGATSEIVRFQIRPNPLAE